jgi:predicted ribonuclease YlaK
MKAVIIDTSVLIHEPTSFLEFVSDYKVLIPIYMFRLFLTQRS